MPYYLQKVKGNKYFVVDTSGKQYSKKPLSKLRAEKQLTALHINTGHGFVGGMYGNVAPGPGTSLPNLRATTQLNPMHRFASAPVQATRLNPMHHSLAEMPPAPMSATEQFRRLQSGFEGLPPSRRRYIQTELANPGRSALARALIEEDERNAEEELQEQERREQLAEREREAAAASARASQAAQAASLQASLARSPGSSEESQLGRTIVSDLVEPVLSHVVASCSGIGSCFGQGRRRRGGRGNNALTSEPIFSPETGELESPPPGTFENVVQGDPNQIIIDALEDKIDELETGLENINGMTLAELQSFSRIVGNILAEHRDKETHQKGV
jgi:hypothetical protein